MSFEYVYVYLNPLKPGIFNYGKFHFDFEPFYVGKGKGKRIYHHVEESKKVINKNYNKHKINTLKKILNSGISEEEFKENYILKLFETNCLFCVRWFEIYVINLIGRSDLNLGPLTNLTDGGDGLINPSTETRKLIGKISSERNSGDGNPIHIKGGHSQETCKKISNSRKESKIAAGSKNPSYKVVNEETISIIISLYEKSYSATKIKLFLKKQRNLNIAETKIYSILKDNNISLRTVEQKNKLHSLHMKEKYKNGLVPPSLGKKSKRTICEYCNKDVAINIYKQFHKNKKCIK